MDKDYALSTSERPVSERPISEGVKSAQSPVHTAPHGSGNGSVRPEEQGHEQGHAIPPEEGYDVGNPPPQGKHALFLRAILVFGVVSSQRWKSNHNMLTFRRWAGIMAYCTRLASCRG